MATKKKLTPLQKLKVQVDTMREDRDYYKRKIENKDEQIETLEKRVEELKSDRNDTQNQLIQSSRDIRFEVEWLRDLVESIVVPAETIAAKKNINEEIEKERRRRGY